MEVSKQAFDLLNLQQKEYDEKIKFLETKIDRLEKIVYQKPTTLQKIYNTTYSLHNLVDNVFFISKLAMPLYLYYKLSK
jgi:hypothetical protein